MILYKQAKVTLNRIVWNAKNIEKSLFSEMYNPYL